MSFGTPLRHRARPKRKQDLIPNSNSHPFWTLLAAPGRSKGGFWSPRGFPKSPKIDMMRIDRHPGGQSGPKRHPEEGFEMRHKILPKRYPKSIIFGMPKPSKSVVRSFKIKVLEVPKKHEKMIKNEVPKGGPFHLFGALWRPLGGQGVTVRPLGVDLERVQKSVIFGNIAGGDKKHTFLTFGDQGRHNSQ